MAETDKKSLTIGLIAFGALGAFVLLLAPLYWIIAVALLF